MVDGSVSRLYVPIMKTFTAMITVTLRSGILDVQGKTVEHALHTMGYTSVGHVRMGKHVTFTVEAETEGHARSIAQESCEKLIANPIMEDFDIRIQEVA